MLLEYVILLLTTEKYLRNFINTVVLRRFIYNGLCRAYIPLYIAISKPYLSNYGPTYILLYLTHGTILIFRTCSSKSTAASNSLRTPHHTRSPSDHDCIYSYTSTDGPSWLINVGSGLFDINQGRFRPFDIKMAFDIHIDNVCHATRQSFGHIIDYRALYIIL